MLPEIIQDREPGNFISHCFGISGFLLLNIYYRKLNKRKKLGKKIKFFYKANSHLWFYRRIFVLRTLLISGDIIYNMYINGIFEIF